MTLMIELLGYAGALAVLVAYAQVTRSGPSRGVHVLNLVGALAILVNAASHHAFPSVMLNAAWLGIAGLGLRGTQRADIPAQGESPAVLALHGRL